MATTVIELSSTPLDALNKAFFLNHPQDAARKLETMLPEDAAALLSEQAVQTVLLLWQNLAPGVMNNILLHLPDVTITALLNKMDINACTAVFSRFDEENRKRFFAYLNNETAKEVNELLCYPEDSVGALMDSHITAFNENITVNDVLTQLRNQKVKDLHHLFLLNDAMYLSGKVPVQRLALADGNETLSSLAVPLQSYVNALDPKDTVIEQLETFGIDSIPVIDGNEHFVGVIHRASLFDSLKDTMSTEMLTMVGASKEEKALSTSWFAVKKRLPWLEINLVTAFLAAAVVGLFESTIAQYTALAVLLPIAAGQSGNTGAQALAVTMRGLTVREITIRHWFKVLCKEAAAGLINGLAIAITCGVGVYLWSQSLGLALIIALSMILSMTIAAVAGALVPITLKKLGQDPALSSSIILTTITDIAGFMSFLGIATLLSGML